MYKTEHINVSYALPRFNPPKSRPPGKGGERMRQQEEEELMRSHFNSESALMRIILCLQTIVGPGSHTGALLLGLTIATTQKTHS